MATKHIKRCSTSSFISEWDTTVHIRLANIKIKALSQKCSADAHVPLGSRSSDGAWSFYVEVVLNGPVSLELLIWIPDPKPVVLWSMTEIFDHLQSRQDSACCGAGVSRHLGAMETNESQFWSVFLGFFPLDLYI